MNFEESLNFLNKLDITNIKLGLENILKVLNFLNNPQKSYKIIHIAGTNGKGSVCKIIHDILYSHGINTGLYTSPHLISPCERIIINNTQIKKTEFAFFFNIIKQACFNLNINLTYFEYLTCLAFLFFKEKKIKYAVIETGLGGRLDATNVLEDKICVITNVSYDHTQFLGNNLIDIAKEKFGIVKENNIVITGVDKSLREKNYKEKILIEYDKNKVSQNIKEINNGIYLDFCYENLIIKNIFIPCLGEYQIDNASIAIIAVIEIFKLLRKKINKKIIKSALSKFYWQARMEIIYINDKKILFEGSHNKAGIEYLGRFLKKQNKKPVIILGILKDKDYINMIKEIGLYAKSIIINSSFHKNSTESELLKRECVKYCKNIIIIESIEELISFILKCKDKFFCITGSLYLIGLIKSYGLGKEE